MAGAKGKAQSVEQNEPKPPEFDIFRHVPAGEEEVGRLSCQNARLGIIEAMVCDGVARQTGAEKKDIDLVTTAKDNALSRIMCRSIGLACSTRIVVKGSSKERDRER